MHSSSLRRLCKLLGKLAASVGTFWVAFFSAQYVCQGAFPFKIWRLPVPPMKRLPDGDSLFAFNQERLLCLVERRQITV